MEKIEAADSSVVSRDVMTKIKKGKTFIVLGAGVVRNVWTNFLKTLVEIAKHLIEHSFSSVVKTKLEQIVKTASHILDFETGKITVPSEVRYMEINTLNSDLSEFVSNPTCTPESFQLKMFLTENYLKTPACTRLSNTVGCVALLVALLDEVRVLDLTYAHDLAWACYYLGISARTVSTVTDFDNKTVLKLHGINYDQCSNCPISNSQWIYSCCFECPSVGPFTPNIVFVSPGDKRNDPNIYRMILTVVLNSDVILIVAFSGKLDSELTSIIKRAVKEGKTVIDIDLDPYSTAFHSNEIITIKGGAASIMPGIAKHLDMELKSYLGAI